MNNRVVSRPSPLSIAFVCSQGTLFFFSCLAQGCLIISKEQYSSFFLFLIGQTTPALELHQHKGLKQHLLSIDGRTGDLSLHLTSSPLRLFPLSLPIPSFSISILHSTSIFTSFHSFYPSVLLHSFSKNRPTTHSSSCSLLPLALPTLSSSAATSALPSS